MRWAGLILALSAGLTGPALAASDERPGFALSLDGVLSRLALITHALMPGAHLELQITPGAGAAVPRLVTGTARPDGPGRWLYRAPDAPGAVDRLVWAHGDQRMTLQLLVMRPLAEAVDGRLNGYRIGAYPARAFKGLSAYAPPQGLIEVSPELAALPVSPNFRLGQFLCKQEGGFPKYLLLRPRLLVKLEHLLARAREAGLATEPFVIMSAYRTPYYNAAIGNRTRYSRHVYGGAADIYIDESPRDGVMDDLNGDGRIDARDAQVLYDLIDGESSKRSFKPLLGGLAKYRTNPVHGPFVHVDERGWRARWGH